MILTVQIGNMPVILECEERWRTMGEEALLRIEAAHHRGPAIHDGTRIQYTWSVFTLRKEGKTLRVCEPAFSKDPTQELCPTVDVTLSVLAGQLRVLRRVHASGEDVLWQQKVMTLRGVLDTGAIYLKRLEPESAEDSGWYIGDLEDIRDADRENTEAIQVYELLRLRPTLLDVLTLPPGFIVTMSGKTILQIFDQEGHDCWKRAEPDTGRAGFALK